MNGARGSLALEQGEVVVVQGNRRLRLAGAIASGTITAVFCLLVALILFTGFLPHATRGDAAAFLIAAFACGLSLFLPYAFHVVWSADEVQVSRDGVSVLVRGRHLSSPWPNVESSQSYGSGEWTSYHLKIPQPNRRRPRHFLLTRKQWEAITRGRSHEWDRLMTGLRTPLPTDPSSARQEVERVQ